MPSRNSIYWSKKQVFIERVALLGLPASSKSPLGNLRLTLKVHALNSRELWESFQAHRLELEKAISTAVRESGGGKIEIEEMNFERGSIEIVLLLKAASAALAPFVPIFGFIGLVVAVLGLIFNFIKEYPSLKRGAIELSKDIKSCVESLEQVLQALFDRWLGHDGLSPEASPL